MKGSKHEKKRWCAIGLMSGTSMDGIDLAVLTTNGRRAIERGPGQTFAYDPAFRRRIEKGLTDAQAIDNRDDRPGSLAQLEAELTLRHADAVRKFLAASRIRASDIDVIGFHGQTVLHRPVQGLTVQIGDGRLLASETGIPVIYDLRANDMAKGGQGAPLVPVYHRALASNLPENLSRWPIAFVNVGGIANMTWISRKGEMFAFDTGPGNALIDQWVAAKAGIPYDDGGAIASEGSVNAHLARTYLRSAYFDRKAPKSLDRNDFLPPAAEAASLEDGARTLAHVTAASIVRAFDQVPEPPRVLVLCGGGRKNRAIVTELSELATGARQSMRIVSAEDAGFDGDSMEAEAWAYLAVRSMLGLKISWPGTTGIPKAASGGLLVRPQA
jgi:anhydro-N-acetylmuramic acid kinase